MATSSTPNLDALIEAATTSMPCLEQAMVRLKTSPLDIEALEGTCRHLHSIGKAASLAEWTVLAYLAHGAEGLLADVLDGFGQLDPPTLDLLSHSLTVMHQLLQQLDPVEPEAPRWSPDSDNVEKAEVIIEAFITEIPPDQSKERTEAAANFIPRYAPGQPFAFETATSNTGDTREQQKRSKRTADFTRSPLTSRPQEQQAERAITIISKLQQQRSSGLLLLKRGAGVTYEEGAIQFTNGQITSAQAGRRTGAEARNWLSTWTNCRFIFRPASSTKEASK